MMKRDLKIKFFLMAVCGICLSLTAGAKSDSIDLNTLEGVWQIDTTVVKRTIDSGYVTTKIFPPGDTAKSFVQRPEKITFAANQIIFEYAEMTDPATYTITGNTLQVEFSTHLAEYRYKIEQGKLQLNHTAKFLILSDDNKMQQLEEEYIFRAKIVTKKE